MKSHPLILSAVLFATATISLHADEQFETLRGSCSIAASDQADRVRFRLESGTCNDGRGHCNTNNSDIALSSFSGFSTADLAREGDHLDAVITAEAGKLTCSGTVHDKTLTGNFTFVPDTNFVSHMQQMGFTGFDSNKLEAYTLFHIETTWIKSLQAAGVGNMDVDNLIALRIFKVDAGYVKDMSALGFPNLPAGKLIAFKVHGVNPDEVKQYRALGYQPTSDELIQMRIFKITPDFIHRMKARDLHDLTIAKLVQIKIFDLAE